MKPTFTLTMVSLFVVLSISDAYGQRPSMQRRRPSSAYSRPAVSPYLDLVTGAAARSSLEYQYFRRYQPDVTFRRADNRLGQSVRGLGQRLQQQNLQQIGATGHSVGFMTHRGRFGTVAGGRR